MSFSEVPIECLRQILEYMVINQNHMAVSQEWLHAIDENRGNLLFAVTPCKYYKILGQLDFLFEMESSDFGEDGLKKKGLTYDERRKLKKDLKVFKKKDTKLNSHNLTPTTPLETPKYSKEIIVHYFQKLELKKVKFFLKRKVENNSLPGPMRTEGDSVWKFIDCFLAGSKNTITYLDLSSCTCLDEKRYAYLFSRLNSLRELVIPPLIMYNLRGRRAIECYKLIFTHLSFTHFRGVEKLTIILPNYCGKFLEYPGIVVLPKECTQYLRNLKVLNVRGVIIRGWENLKNLISLKTVKLVSPFVDQLKLKDVSCPSVVESLVDNFFNLRRNQRLVDKEEEEAFLKVVKNLKRVKLVVEGSLYRSLHESENSTVNRFLLNLTNVEYLHIIEKNIFQEKIPEKRKKVEESSYAFSCMDNLRKLVLDTRFILIRDLSGLEKTLKILHFIEGRNGELTEGKVANQNERNFVQAIPCIQLCCGRSGNKEVSGKKCKKILCRRKHMYCKKCESCPRCKERRCKEIDTICPICYRNPICTNCCPIECLNCQSICCKECLRTTTVHFNFLDKVRVKTKDKPSEGLDENLKEIVKERENHIQLCKPCYYLLVLCRECKICGRLSDSMLECQKCLSRICGICCQLRKCKGCISRRNKLPHRKSPAVYMGFFGERYELDSDSDWDEYGLFGRSDSDDD